MAGILNAIQLSSKGLSVQRSKMNVVAKNIANAETTKTENGGPYRRQRIVVSEDQVNIKFDTHLKTAGLRLNRTNDGHLHSRIKTISSNTKMSSVDMNIVEDDNSNFFN